MIEQAYVSGQLATAIYHEGDGRFFLCAIDDDYVPREARTAELNFLLSMGAEFTEVRARPLDIGAIRSALATEARNRTALFLALAGLDEKLAAETRLEAKREAEGLLKEAEKFVRNRLVSMQAPAGIFAFKPTFDLSLPILSSIYEEAFLAQDVVEEVFDCWKYVALEYFKSSDEAANAEQAVIDSGFIRAVVQGVVSNQLDGLNETVVSYLLDSELKGRFPQAPHVLNSFRARILSTFSQTLLWGRPRDHAAEIPSPAIEQDTDYISQLITGFNPYDPNRRISRLSAHESVSRVQKQIEAIKNLLFTGNLGLAERFLHELLQFNFEHGEREHVAMTLCNLSAIALDANELEMAERLAEHALQLGVEEDPVVYATHAEVLRRSARFDEALQEYRKIKERFPESGHIQNAYAETLRDMGRYDDSLAAYLAVRAGFPDDPVAYNGYAGVLRSMGRPYDALRQFRAAVDRFNDPISRTAYADLLRFLGQFDLAVKVASESRKLFPREIFVQAGFGRVLLGAGMLEEAHKFYADFASKFPDSSTGLLGQAAVSRQMGKLDLALTIYNRLIRESPNDPIARNERAGVLILLGRTTDAARDVNSNRLQSELDWRGYLLSSLVYLKAGENDEALTRLNRGYHTCPWRLLRSRFAAGLGLAMMRTQEPSGAVRVLQTDLNAVDFVRRHGRLLLLSHAQAESGRLDVAKSVLHSIPSLANTTIDELKSALSVRYGFSNAKLVPSLQQRDLSQLIELHEFAIAMA